MLNQKTARDKTWKGQRNWNSHHKPLNAITHFTTRNQVLTKSVTHKSEDYFGMAFTVILSYPVSQQGQTVNTQHFCNTTYVQYQHDGGEAGTNNWSPVVQKGALGPTMLHMFSYFMVVPFFVDCTNQLFQTKPKSLCN
jgi:hypothetical protein